MRSALTKFQKYFSFPEEEAYFNCAAHGPLSKPASNAVLAGLRDKENPKKMDQGYGLDHVKSCRRALSQLIDWPESKIALANSTSWGVNTVVRGLKLKPGDEVVFFEGQFPSNVVPWELLKGEGISCVKVPSPGFVADIKALEKTLTSKTKIVSLEWVHFVSGDRIPLQEITEICHKKDILVLVDITQGLGALPFSMKEMGVDAVACSGYKWLYSPYGTGFFALNDNLFEKLSPFYLNWLSLDSGWSDNLCNLKIEDLYTSAHRFDTSSQMGYLNLDGLTASVEMLNTFDIAENFKGVLNLVYQLREELNPQIFKPLNCGLESRQSLIATFKIEGFDSLKLISDLERNGITTCLRNGHIRISPSIYNDSEQVTRLCRIANNQ